MVWLLFSCFSKIISLNGLNIWFTHFDWFASFRIDFDKQSFQISNILVSLYIYNIYTYFMIVPCNLCKLPPIVDIKNHIVIRLCVGIVSGNSSCLVASSHYLNQYCRQHHAKYEISMSFWNIQTDCIIRAEYPHRLRCVWGLQIYFPCNRCPKFHAVYMLMYILKHFK